MYIWIGCRLPQTFEDEIRGQCLALNEAIGLDTSAFSLPQHISLKISFPAPDGKEDEIVAYLARLLRGIGSFSVEILPPEQNGNILWLPTAENTILEQLHEALDTHLLKHFGIPQHSFDRCFRFHSTLFMDAPERLGQMLRLMDGYPFCRTLTVASFLIGASPDGSPGSYRVVREVSCKKA